MHGLDVPAPDQGQRPWAPPSWEGQEGGWLVADEDPAARAALLTIVRSRVGLTLCSDGPEALWLAGRLQPAVVLLSASLPGIPAFDVASVLARHRGGRPSVLVGVGVGEADRAGSVLAAGATGLVSRPYTESEIEPLVRAQLQEAERLHRERAVLTAGGLRLDGPAYEASAWGRPLRLRLREFELLRLLMIRPGAVVTLDQIRREVWDGRGETIRSNTIAVHIRHLRVHLAGVAEIVAVRGVGYRLCA